MNVEIIKQHGDLKREVWAFSLSIGYSSSCIYFDRFSVQTKGSKRQNWKVQSHWDRLNRRDNSITTPLLDPEVELEMRARYQEYIFSLPITC